MEQQNLSATNELFVLPTNTYQVAKIEHLPLYTSDKLLEKFKKVARKDKMGKLYHNELSKLIDKRIINPVWLSKGLLGLVKHKLIGGTDKMVMGFFYPGSGKIYVIIDNHITLGYASNRALMNVAVHEAVHYASWKTKMNFLKYFETELTTYYSRLFRELFNIPDSENIDASSKKLYTFLFKNIELKTTANILPVAKKYTKILVEEFQHVDNYQSKITDVVSLMYIYLKAGIGGVVSNNTRYKDIFSGLYKGYYDLTSKSNLRTLCIQELIYPSEVICIYSEFAQSAGKIKGILKKVS